MVNVAERWLMLVGLKVTLIVQLAPPATDVPQVLVCAKSPGFVPERAMLEMVSVVAPPFFKVTTCGLLVVCRTCAVNVRAMGVTVTLEVPVPLNAAVCGLDPALSATDTVALRAPVAVGIKVTVMMQLCFGSTDVPQLLVCAKSVGFVPVMVRLVMVTVLPPLSLVRVIACEALVVPTV